jgi:hypothetical protein
MASRSVLLAATLFATFCVLAIAGPNQPQTRGNCGQANNYTCQVANPYGFMKVLNSLLVDDSVQLSCCNTFSGLNGGQFVCYDARMDDCMDANEAYYGPKVVCNKFYQKPCGNTCYNTHSQVCTSAKAISGDYYLEGAVGSSLGNSTVIRVIVVPLFGILFSLIAFLVSVLSIRHVWAGLSMPQKIGVILTIPILFACFFLYFGSNSGWKYAAFTMMSVCLTACAMAIEVKFLTQFSIYFNLAVLLFLVGPPLGGNLLFSAGNGVFSAVSSCADTDPNWANHWTIQNVGQDASVTNWNPAINYWGFCAPGFMSFQAFNAIFLIVLYFFFSVIHLCQAFSVAGPSGEPLLGKA